MPSNLVEYIKTSLAQGFSRQAIETNLLQAGWTKEQIDQSFLERKPRNSFLVVVCTVEIILGVLGILHILIGLVTFLTLFSGIPLTLLGLVGYRELRSRNREDPISPKELVLHITLLSGVLVGSSLIFPFEGIAGGSDFDTKIPDLLVGLWPFFNTYTLTPIFVRVAFVILLATHLGYLTFSKTTSEVFSRTLKLILRFLSLGLVILSILWIVWFIGSDFVSKNKVKNKVDISFDQNKLLTTRYYISFKSDQPNIKRGQGNIGGYYYSFEDTKHNGIIPDVNIYIYNSSAEAKKEFDDIGMKWERNSTEREEGKVQRDGDNRYTRSHLRGCNDNGDCKYQFSGSYEKLILREYLIIDISYPSENSESEQDSSVFIEAVAESIKPSTD